MLSLLNFASGYRIPLHQQTGRGAWDTIRAFVFGLYLSSSSGEDGDLLSAQGMKVIGSMKVAELLGVNVHVEKPHDSIPAVIVSEVGGDGWEVVQLITSVMNETGSILVDGGYRDLGGFVLEALKEGDKASKEKGEDIIAEIVVERVGVICLFDR